MGDTIEIRTRSLLWFAAGAVLAVATTIIISSAWGAEAAPGDVDATFVPTAGCRLIDTRSGPTNVGSRTSPLGQDDIHEVTVRGANGECTGSLAIPADAVGVALNATAVGATAQSNIRIYPADLTSPPNLSNINVTPGGPPTPNKVDVQLSPDGKIKIYNYRGLVNIILDIVGYYTDASLTEIEQRLTALETPRTSYAMIPAAAFHPRNNAVQFSKNGVRLKSNNATPDYYAETHLPHGATVTAVTLFALDNEAATQAEVELFRAAMPGSTGQSMASIVTVGAAPGSRAFTDATINDPVIDLETNAYYLSVTLPATFANLRINAVRIEYLTP